MTLAKYRKIRREIARCSALPVRFDGFLDVGTLGDGLLELDCVDKLPADLIYRYAPAYNFEIKLGGKRIGAISLRVGYSKSLFYSGQIGYSVDSQYRGRGYAGRACRLLRPLMRAHGMEKILITNNPENAASRRVCEKLGARLLLVAKIPWTHELYRVGDRYKNIFEWDIK
jgi:tagatose 1,6-diphosphate aldolase